ncbi:MAG: hypothetical protein MUC53_01060 [Candidatus Contendobacter sp.]|jgi:plasmid maintenance system antidote protein VapI|nr:hypothetical protein [Candidatus Contendobacter sp.]
MLSFSSIPQSGALYLSKRMDIREIRRQNLALLRQQEGSIRALADRVETDPNYLSQILGFAGKHRMGHAMARRFERAFGKPEGWMDQQHNEKEDGELMEIARMIKLLPVQQRNSVKSLVRSMLPVNADQMQQQM